MIQLHTFPEGKKRIVTFSYDDGASSDKRLIELFNKYGVKGTFHLNSKKYTNYSDLELDGIRQLYSGHEIACHTVSHGWPSRSIPQSVVRETFEDRIKLEQIFGTIVTGMSYPSGSYNDDAIAAMRSCGIVYSRTTGSTFSFAYPEDFMKWHPTCHHKDALPLCDRFLASIDSQYTSPLFYIWGHSHEFRTEQDWQQMIDILEKISGNDKVWYATNIEIYNYFTAQKHLQISADESMIFNPSSIDVWVEKDKTRIIKIPAGKTVYLNETTEI